MKRDDRLKPLSREHHHALVLARRLLAGDEAAARALPTRFAAEMEPHFAVEETDLLPALRAAGEHALVGRLLEDHEALRGYVAAGDPLAFARRLVEHVRFEERDLFPAWERATQRLRDDAVPARDLRPLARPRRDDR